MADTADLRSEGKQLSENPSTVYRRKQTALFKSQGLCAYCGKTHVKNRETCYACSKKQSGHTYTSGLRSFVKLANIDIGTKNMPNTPELTDAEFAELGKLLLKASLYV